MKPYKEYDISMTGKSHNIFNNLKREEWQERLTLFYWYPSIGNIRFTAVISEDIPLPDDNELNLTGNVSFKLEYLLRVLRDIPKGAGIGIVHNHFTSGWQGMSSDDEKLESIELCPIVVSVTDLPLVGLTMGIDGFVTGRIWNNDDGDSYLIRARKTKIVGTTFDLFYDKDEKLIVTNSKRKIASKAVWTDQYQSIIEDMRIGIVGLGSVGSLVVEGLARIGIRKFVLVDRDKIENKNLDRTLGATKLDVWFRKSKVKIAKRTIKKSATSRSPKILSLESFLQDDKIYLDLLDCDFIFSCVDKHYPRYILNFYALSHLIPVIDGGIKVYQNKKNGVNQINWRDHIIAPNRICLDCMNMIDYSIVSEEYAGIDINPMYIIEEGQESSNQNNNVYSFSMNLASSEINLFLGYISSKLGIMMFEYNRQYCGNNGFIYLDLYGSSCKADCDYKQYIAKAHSISLLLKR